MIAPVFADTSYWIALFNPRDKLYLEANRAFGCAPMITSEMVLVEFLNHFSAYGSDYRTGAIELVSTIRTAKQFTVLPQTSELFERAFTLYSRRKDKAWSLTDCASFVIMNDAGIKVALTYDAHFVQAGFVALLRSSSRSPKER